MAVRIYHSLDDLERDLKTVAVSFKPRAAEQVRDVAKDGTKVGRSNARRPTTTSPARPTSTAPTTSPPA